MKLITIMTPCYNEEENVEALYEAVKVEMEKLSNYRYEHLFIDNDSTDRTVEILRKMANEDQHVKVILNARNFGHIRSPHHALLQAKGDAVIWIVADFQDPIDMIPKFIESWENGHKIVIGIKNKSKENPIIFRIRKLYYTISKRISDNEMISNFTGFGLYDRSFLDVMRTIEDPYPYFRGMIAEMGYQIKRIEYVQPVRKAGKTKNNFYTLYDIGMLGFVNHSKIPLRLASFIGFVVAMFSLLVALVYLIYKLIYWDEFSLGSAPMIIGLFFFSSIQLFFIGIIGEYIGSIHTQVRKRPLVIEKERINY